MSVYIIEDAVQYAVDCIADSGADIQRKRGLVHTLYRLQAYGDCSFTNLRCTESLMRCRYTFLFDREQMWDYQERKDFYERELPAKGMFSQGDLYIYRYFEEKPELDGKICVDSGSAAWEHMVAAGRITGEGAKPLQCPATWEALLEVYRLIGREPG